MADATELEVTVSGDADDAITQINNLKTTVSDLGPAMEHSGIHLLNHDLMSMIGLGGQSRATMGLMSAGIGEVATAFGTATATLAPWLLGVGAAVMVGEKLWHAHEKNTQSLDENIEAMEKGIGSAEELAGSFDHYKDSVGGLTPQLAQLETANRSLAEAEKVLLSIELQEKLEKLRDEQTKLVAVTQNATLADAAAAAEYSRYAAGSDMAHKADKNLAESTATYDVKAKQLAATIASVAAELKILGSGQTNVKKYLDDGADAADKSFEAWNKGVDEMIRFDDAYGKTADAIDKFILKKKEESEKLNEGGDKDDQLTARYDAQIEAASQAYTEIENKARDSGQSLEGIEASRTQYMAALSHNLAQKQEEDTRQSFGLQKTALMDYQSAASSVASTIEGDFTKSFATQVVQGKSMTSAMHALYSQIEIDAIEKLTEIALKDVALALWTQAQKTYAAITGATAQTSATASGAAASTAAVTAQVETQKALYASLAGTAAFADSAELGPYGLAAAPGAAAAAVTTAMAFALGGDMMVDTPTTFLAGESGPERVQVSPMYAGGNSSGAAAGGNGGGGGGSASISVSVTAAGVVTDINAFAQMIGQKVARAVRGQGQLQFVRSS